MSMTVQNSAHLEDPCRSQDLLAVADGRDDLALGLKQAHDRQNFLVQCQVLGGPPPGMTTASYSSTATAEKSKFKTNLWPGFSEYVCGKKKKLHRVAPHGSQSHWLHLGTMLFPSMQA